MSLICVRCGKAIVLSNKPDHYGCCGEECRVELTQEDRELIRKSAEEFRAKSKVLEKGRES